jgi:O-antigen ligase
MSDFYSHYNKSTVGLEHNAHNQYLQTWMENGLPGLMLFLFCLLFPFLEKKLTSTHIVFLLIFSLMCLTESIGERQKGIVFFTLFQTLFTAFDSAKR